MRTAAVLPVKRFAAAKQRLAASIDAQLRLALARAMVADVLQALSEVEQIERIYVVSGEPTLPTVGEGERTVIVADERDSGQSAAAKLGVRCALAAGAERVLCVPGDCPALEPYELRALLARSEPAAADALAVVVADRHGSGTNALLLSPPDAIAPAFGPGSFERHLELAARAGVRCRVEYVPSLALDIDTGADLAALRELLAARGQRAARTRALLAASPGAVPLGVGC